MAKTNERRQRTKQAAWATMHSLLSGLPFDEQVQGVQVLGKLMRLIAGDSYRQGFIAGKKVKK